MAYKIIKGVLILTLFLSISACHSMKFKIADGQVGNVVKDRKSFFLFGIVPTENVDLALYCPNGTIAVAESTSFLDGFLGFVTLGIYTPRSSTYYCAARVN